MVKKSISTGGKTQWEEKKRVKRNKPNLRLSVFVCVDVVQELKKSPFFSAVLYKGQRDKLHMVMFKTSVSNQPRGGGRGAAGEEFR